jgi:hypothetical protein
MKTLGIIILLISLWVFVQTETGGVCSQFTAHPERCNSDMKEGVE